MRGTSLDLEERERFRFYDLPSDEREKLLREVGRLLSLHGEVVLAVVYGSITRGWAFRDVDVAVYVRGCADPLGYELGLGEELTRSLGYPVDVKVLNEAPPWFVKKVLREGRVLLSTAQLIVEKLYLKAVDEEGIGRSAANNPKQT